MAITPFAHIPSRSQAPSTFATEADVFLGTEIPRFVTEANALAVEVDGIRDNAIYETDLIRDNAIYETGLIRDNAESIRAATAAIRDTTEGFKNAAAGSATSASGFANNAAASASAASGFADAADASAGSAAGSASDAEDSFLGMDKRYLGAKAADPTLDNQGAALQAGAVYYNTSAGKVRTWNGSAWVDGISSSGGVTSFNGQTGDVTGVSSFNGSTGSVTGVASFNGQTGAVTGVSSFNGSSGPVTGVSSFNGQTGVVAGVSSVNGQTGDVNVSAGKTTVVASGSIPSSGLVVTLNNDGTVSTVINTGNPSTGTAVVFESANTQYTSCCYDSVNEKLVIAYVDAGNSSYGTAIVGTVSGASISFGTAVVFNSATTQNISCCYDVGSGKVVIAYNYSGAYYGRAIVGTVSGTSISFGTAVVFESVGTYDISCCYDHANEKVVIAYAYAGNSYYGTAIVGTVSGTSISFGTAVVFESANTTFISCCYDHANEKVVIAYADAGNSNYGTAIVGTVLGTSISFGTAVVFESANTQRASCCYDSANKKVVVTYQDNGNSYYGTAIVGKVSGTSISFGTAVVFSSANTQYISCCCESVSGKVVIAYQNYSSSYYGTAIVFAVPYSTNSKRIGISTASATHGTSTIVTTLGGVNENVSGLTPGSAYYVEANGALTATAGENPKIGHAITANKLLITEVM